LPAPLKRFWYHRLRSNLHPLDPPQAWRIARGSRPAEDFQAILKQLGIRTAIDLRRANSSDQKEGQIDFAALGVDYHNLHLRSSDLPHPQALARFVELLNQAERPLLLYCKRGKDKTGFGSALYRHLVCGEGISEAWQQLRFIPFGHRRPKHEGPHWFRNLVEQENPADLRAWIREQYPTIFEQKVARGEVIPITVTGDSPQSPSQDPKPQTRTS
jgi:protein tyrosine/serine phosphatase